LMKVYKVFIGVYAAEFQIFNLSAMRSLSNDICI
jgi:hypothetical protein